MFASGLLISLTFAPNSLAALPDAAKVTPVQLCETAAFGARFGSELRCIATPYGVAISKGEEADRYAEALMAGGKSFEQNFAPVGKPVALVAKSLLGDAQTRVLTDAGYQLFEWLSESDVKGRSETKASIAKQLSSVLPLPASEVEARAEEITKKVYSNTDVLPHELNHLWFKNYFEPQTDSKATDRYSSEAPDWLDETAAVLAEKSLVDNRRRLMNDVIQNDPQQLIPLERLLSMDHPHAAEGLANRPKPGSPEAKGTVIKFSARPAQPGSLTKNVGAVFYAEVLAFADFLMETSGNRRIFADVASALRSGSTFEQWLAARGAGNRLPSTLSALEPLWAKWLQDHHGQTAGKAGEEAE